MSKTRPTRAGSRRSSRVPAGFGLILREKEPLNLESSQTALRDGITPSDLFYVRNHFAEPNLNRTTWRLSVEGAVKKPCTFSYRDLTTMASLSQVSLIECAGNGRVFLAPKAGGVQWQSGAVGNAEFTGVPLTALLTRVGILPTAVDVIFEGADHGEIEDEPTSPGDIHFARSVPVATGREGGLLLAYKMNGATLTRSHGFPVRVVVPGWYGMASVKWLTRIVVTDKPFDGFFQTLQYSRWSRMHGTPTLIPVTELQVKSIIITPEVGSIIPAGETYTVRGQAWTGVGTIARVEVSVDGGKTWATARLTSPASPYTWRSWAFDWRPVAGQRSVMVRATDSEGRTQPMDRDKDWRSYAVTHVVSTPVMVRDCD